MTPLQTVSGANVLGVLFLVVLVAAVLIGGSITDIMAKARANGERLDRIEDRLGQIEETVDGVDTGGHGSDD